MFEIKITTLFKGENELCKLTATEARILNFFIEHPNLTFSAEQLAEKLELKSPNYARSCVSKLANNLALGLPFEQIKKKGWRWINESEAENE
jgi:DNA-binding response OmpR family regulator